MTPAKVLATDVYLEKPHVGQNAIDGARAVMMGTARPERFAKGTKASDLPDWVLTAKATDANGNETDQPLLGDHVWADEPASAAAAPASSPGITLSGGTFSVDGAFTPFETLAVFVEGNV